MPYFKDQYNNIHQIDAMSDSNLIPPNSTFITDIEFETMQQAIVLPNPRIYEIKQLLDVLDMKKIRPIAEGDTVYLAVLNKQTLDLRTELLSLLN